MVNETAYGKSLELLHHAATTSGYIASIQKKENARRIWTRDGAIISLAALFSKEESLIATAKATIETIFEYQHTVGFMPSSVRTIDYKVSYGGTAGRADNTSWAIIALCHYSVIMQDTLMAALYAKHVEKCFSLMDAWEFNGKHLMYVPQSGDWAGEYIQHGYILYNQLLRLWALRLAADLYGREDWKQKAVDITEVIQVNFWNNQQSDRLYTNNQKHLLQGAPLDFWFMGFNPTGIYNQFDLQANSLALLLNIGNDQQNKTLLELLELFYRQQQHILPSFFPAILENDVKMQELENNYEFILRNKPYEFHNGGLWCVWNGLLAAALVKHGKEALAMAITGKIHDANAKNNYEFNECLHGLTKEPIGVPCCTWTAAGAIIAEKSLQQRAPMLMV